MMLELEKHDVEMKNTKYNIYILYFCNIIN